MDAIVDVLEILINFYLLINFSLLLTFVIYSTLTLNSYLSQRAIENKFNLNYGINYVDVSIIVPAHNEELTIIKTIESLLALNYNDYDIIIVNDGSKDETGRVIIDNYNLKKESLRNFDGIQTKEVLSIYSAEKNEVKITLINKINGGKADSLNVGINYSTKPIFVAVDADSVLEKNSLRNIVKPFMNNRKTIAVGGNIRISNFIELENGEVIKVNKYRGLIPCFQIIEYLRSFLLSRVVFNKLNMNLIISGAFGAFKRDEIIKIGGYKRDTIGEDMELVMRLHKSFINKGKDYRIQFAPDAICYTQAPEDLKGIKTQRKRWQIGLIHSMSMHKEMVLTYNWFLAKTYYILFELITPIVEFLGIGLLIFSIISNAIDYKLFFMYTFMVMMNGFVMSVFSLVLDSYFFENKQSLVQNSKLILISLLECFGYRQVVSVFRLLAFVGYSKNKDKWGEIKRVG